MIIREAKPEDKGDILEISSQVWEGHDYVPLVLDRWLEEGGLLAAELDGKVVGFAKTTVLGPGELWFEGLRVHPSYRGRGIAKALAEAQLQEALARAPRPRSIRLATAEVNRESIHIAEELGFREVARFTYMRGPVGEGPETGSPEVLQTGQQARGELAEFIFGSEAYCQSHGLLPHGWVFKEFSRERLGELIQQGALFCYGEGERVRGVIALLPAPYRPEHVVIAFIEGDDEALSALMDFAHCYGRDRGFAEFRAMVPTERLVQFLKGHGLTFEPDFRYVLVYEYPLP